MNECKTGELLHFSGLICEVAMTQDIWELSSCNKLQSECDKDILPLNSLSEMNGALNICRYPAVFKINNYQS